MKKISGGGAINDERHHGWPTKENFYFELSKTGRKA